jgi:cell wall-associated NlpC family hydrolase
MAVSRKKVVESALSFEKTPWIHGARIKHVGIDCTGLVICSFNEAGAEIPDVFDYSLFDEFSKLVRILNEFCNKESKKIEPADILLFRGEDMFNHVGIAIDSSRFVHAYSVPSVMSVVIQRYDAYWKQRLKGIYSFKEFK